MHGVTQRGAWEAWGGHERGIVGAWESMKGAWVGMREAWGVHGGMEGAWACIGSAWEPCRSMTRAWDGKVIHIGAQSDRYGYLLCSSDQVQSDGAHLWNLICEHADLVAWHMKHQAYADDAASHASIAKKRKLCDWNQTQCVMWLWRVNVELDNEIVKRAMLMEIRSCSRRKKNKAVSAYNLHYSFKSASPTNALTCNWNMFLNLAKKLKWFAGRFVALSIYMCIAYTCYSLPFDTNASCAIYTAPHQPHIFIGDAQVNYTCLIWAFMHTHTHMCKFIFRRVYDFS